MAKVIDIKTLRDEKVKLTKEFEELRENIIKLETATGTQKSNLNALSGAIQQIDILLQKIDPKIEEVKDKTIADASALSGGK
jgi:predicted nuclease with TOPRIM domain